MDIIVSLDYELFLNDITGSVENCLIKPTMEFQRICDKYKIEATIFVDAAYLFRLNELRTQYYSLQQDYDNTVDNIKWLVEKGHDVQLHIHPQWYYSDFNGSEWQLDWEHYKLSDMPADYAFDMFEKSKALLDSLVGYKTTLFRAGGYSIQDFDYVECFKKNGIIGDSSVLPGSCKRLKTHSYDYRKALFNVYKFEKDIIRSQNKGKFCEFPICATKAVFITKYRRVKKAWMTKTENNWGDGGNLPFASKIEKIKALIASFELFKHPHGTIDYQSYFWLRDAYDFSKQFGYMTIIGHPKNFSTSSINYFEEFVREKQQKGDEFVTMCKYITKYMK